jgi:hypothetical protein
MHEQESNELTECLDCGSVIAPAADHAFAVDSERFLCFGCAAKRGGVFDQWLDRWALPPDIFDLSDERRPHL